MNLVHLKYIIIWLYLRIGWNYSWVFAVHGQENENIDLQLNAGLVLNKIQNKRNKSNLLKVQDKFCQKYIFVYITHDISICRYTGQWSFHPQWSPRCHLQFCIPIFDPHYPRDKANQIHNHPEIVLPTMMTFYFEIVITWVLIVMGERSSYDPIGLVDTTQGAKGSIGLDQGWGVT